MRRKTKSDTRTATRYEAQVQMCRKTKASVKEELINEFPETLNDELNEQPMRSGEPKHIHLQDGAQPRKTTVPRQVAKRFEKRRKHYPKLANNQRSVGERTRGNRKKISTSTRP